MDTESLTLIGGFMFKSIGSALASIWNFLSGKKRNIALAYWSIVVPSIVIIWPTQIPSGVGKASAIAGLILTVIGLGHGLVKYINGKAVLVEEVKVEEPKTEVKVEEPKA